MRSSVHPHTRLPQRQHQQRVERGHDVVGHHAEAPVPLAIDRSAPAAASRCRSRRNKRNANASSYRVRRRRKKAPAETRRLRRRRSRRDRHAEVPSGASCGPDADDEMRRRSRRRMPRRSRSARNAAAIGSATRVPKVPGAIGASPAPKPSAMRCAGCANRNRNVGVLTRVMTRSDRNARGNSMSGRPASSRTASPVLRGDYRRCASTRARARAPSVAMRASRVRGAVKQSS